ncbi:MAG: leucyl/phenylalanyl-tRNA--protein transferase [Burkholderiaceae bacterium]|nr:leucyl/phenylalanyl-tRNA--protein transferase [Burkholderiaceae bacterium]MDZ4160894.1 leucyl/phenylalanyl-tRNA--protein transferase [Burkholderiales bacterium]
MPYPHLPWLDAGVDFPPIESAWSSESPAPGLLAAGDELNANVLLRAYRQGIFPWFSEGQPVLWWSTHPRMVLLPQDFTWPLSLRKQIRSLLKRGQLNIRMDTDFMAVMQACAQSPRPGQSGTWISPAMQSAYASLHQQGHAHSVETWWDKELVGGLYLVNVGGMVFGESMFSRRSNASKIALAALVAFCLVNRLPMIDCQQETDHLASLGARPWPRADFLCQLDALVDQDPPAWRFEPDHWTCVFGT